MDTRWAFRLLLFSSTALLFFATAGATTVTGSCCDVPDGSSCCPELPIGDLADNLSLPEERRLRTVYDPVRCCSDSDEMGTGCTAYGTEGCSFCRNVCEDDDDSCVLCSVADSFGSTDITQVPTISTPAPISTLAPISLPVSDGSKAIDDGEWPLADETDIDEFNDINTSLSAGSYDFTDNPDQYDCSTCSWENMSSLEKRILNQRSRSMVCDSSCLRDNGDADYGVTLCNYFNTGKECRACCHEGHIFDGCMPCEGEGSCESCISKITKMCKAEPCQPECQAYVCCSVQQWAEYSGCEETMHYQMGEIAQYISAKCNTFFTCEGFSPTCSDNARTCSATSGNVVSRRLQEGTHRRCRMLEVTGAGVFNARYNAGGFFGEELIFRSFGDAKDFTLQSVDLDACTGLDQLSFINAESIDIIVARSSTGSLAWDDGTEPHPHVMNTGVGCPRHVWLLQDTTGTSDHIFVTVDESQHPQFISSDWVRVDSDGKMVRADVETSCIKEKIQDTKF